MKRDWVEGAIRAALTAAIGAGLLMWRDVAVLQAQMAELQARWTYYHGEDLKEVRR